MGMEESFSHWFDYSPNIHVARLGFTLWCQQGEGIEHEAVQSDLKTMRNWE
jgi:transposase